MSTALTQEGGRKNGVRCATVPVGEIFSRVFCFVFCPQKMKNKGIHVIEAHGFTQISSSTPLNNTAQNSLYLHQSISKNENSRDKQL
jgi:hypothetical protein